MVIQWHTIFTINTPISAQLKITSKLSFWTVLILYCKGQKYPRSCLFECMHMKSKGSISSCRPWNIKCFLLPLGIPHMFPPWTRAVWSHFNLLLMGFTFQSVFGEHSLWWIWPGAAERAGWKKKIEPFSWLVHQGGFSAHFLLLPSEYSIILYQQNLGYLQAQCDLLCTF